jgi:predicted anti-sigma-YlaC factor YlaD
VRARESISAQLDSEPSELDSARLSAHLRECPACSSHAHELAAIAAHLRTTPLERPDFELWLPRRRLTAALRVAPMRAAAAAAVLLMAATLTLIAGHRAATSGDHGTTSALPAATRGPHAAFVRQGVAPPHADVVERQVLAMRRDARSRHGLSAGRLIFV